MKQTYLENLEDELGNILCDIDKIITIEKVLSQTLIETSDFEIKDTQNLCSILINETHIIKAKLNKLESSCASMKTSCR